jgi:hypothetical protein
MQYHTVYEICNSDFWANCFPQLIGLITCFAVVCYVLFRPPSKSKEPIGLQERFINAFHGFKDMSIYRWLVTGWLFLVAFVLMCLMAFSVLQSYSKWAELTNAYKSGTCQQVEGFVTDFIPAETSIYDVHQSNSRFGTAPPGAEKRYYESFTVNGYRFEYSDEGSTTGFSKISVRGGPIKEGLRVRIWFSGNRNSIARLDVAETKSNL